MCLVSLQAIINALICYSFVVKQEITALLLQPTTVTGKLVVSDIKKKGGKSLFNKLTRFDYSLHSHVL